MHMTTSVFVSYYTQTSVRRDIYFEDSRSDIDINVFLLLGIVCVDIDWATCQIDIASAEWKKVQGRCNHTDNKTFVNP